MPDLHVAGLLQQVVDRLDQVIALLNKPAETKTQPPTTTVVTGEAASPAPPPTGKAAGGLATKPSKTRVR